MLLSCRENEQLSKYGDTKSARSIMLVELKKLIEANPLFREKLVFPTLKASRLRTLINQRFESNLMLLHYQTFGFHSNFSAIMISPPNVQLELAASAL